MMGQDDLLNLHRKIDKIDIQLEMIFKNMDETNKIFRDHIKESIKIRDCVRDNTGFIRICKWYLGIIFTTLFGLISSKIWFLK